MKAVFLDYDTMGPGLDLAPLYAVTPDLTIYDGTAKDQVAERISDADIVYTNKINLTEKLLASAPKLRLVALTATGTDNVDLEQASRSGIAVANIRDYCTSSVVEHVFGVLLMLTRSLSNYRATVAAGEWQNADNPVLFSHPIRELSAMTLGIVGYGSLGKGVAAAAEAFGMDVIVSARPVRAGPGACPDTAGARIPFDEVLARADVVSLHCPLNEETRNLFGAKQFTAMKESAFLINTARGGLVDSRALAAALENGDIAGAAVDVLPTEPPINGDPLLDYEGENLIVTPHIAWATNEARQNAIDELAANAAAFLAGKSRNRVV